MADRPQNLGNHTRFHPLWHFVAFPLVLVPAIRAIKIAVTERTAEAHWEMAFMLGVVLAVFAARAQTLIVQDRVIRLEMQLRLRALMGGAADAALERLTVKQLVALRFAGDAELPGLVERTLKGEFAKPSDIKKAVTSWRADWLRA